MARFGFRTASSLRFGENGDLLFHFILAKIVAYFFELNVLDEN